MKKALSIGLILGMAASASSRSLDDVVTALAAPECRHATVRYEVLMPSAADPVVYTVDLLSASPSDTLAPCDYLIRWTLPRGERVSEGFSSYHAGDHFRYRDTRLQEYHASDDPTPFGGEKGGVQLNAQFADLLAPMIARTLEVIAADTTYRSVFDPEACTLQGVRTVGGYDALEFSYRFDPATLLPTQIDFEYNPGSISEQTVTANYEWDPAPACPTIDETYLTTTFPEVFERFRTSNFRVENLRGTLLPAYTARTPDRQRIAHNRGEALPAPAVYLFLDPMVTGNQAVLEAVLTARASLPTRADIVVVYGDVDDATAVIPDFTTLVGARSLIRDCGITAYPTVLVVDSSSTIRDAIIGTIPDLDTRLAQTLIVI